MKSSILHIFSIISLSIFALLSACSVQPGTVTFDNVTYQNRQVRGNLKTYTTSSGQTLRIETAGDETRVSVDGQVYRVTGAENQLRVIFPDGRELSKQYEQNASSGASAPGVEVSMQDWDRVDALREIVFHTSQNAQASKLSRNLLLGAVIFGVGLLQAAKPRLAWQISEGWRYQNVEPSDLYLSLSRAAGVVIMLVALFVAFQS